MAKLHTFSTIKDIKGLKLVHLNVRSLLKKMDQVRLLLRDSEVDILSISETWLKTHLHSNLVSIQGYKLYRQDRALGPLRKKKRGGGLITYIADKHASMCESLQDMDRSDETIEAQWTLIHRPNCKNVVTCNLYRPPEGNLKKALDYLDESISLLNVPKTDLFIVGDWNVNYKNQSSPEFKKLNFFITSNGLSQHIKSMTRNTDKTNSLIDLALSNSKFISSAGTLEHYISDHQPIYLVHKKGRDVRESAKFEGRSYKNYNKDKFREQLHAASWDGFYEQTNPEAAWDIILKNIISVLDVMCPIRSFHIKNYRPEWMTNELIEQLKDRDYFYSKAKKEKSEDSWNIAKYLRNATNSNIRQAKRDFILEKLNHNKNEPKKFWKTIRKVMPTKKSTNNSDILLKNGPHKLEREKVAEFVNEYFIKVGKSTSPTSTTNNAGGDGDEVGHGHVGEREMDWKFGRILDREVLRVVKDINVSKSSGLDNVSSFVIKEAFTYLIPEVTYMYNLSVDSSIFPNAWKKATVVPIPKSGDLTKVKNYRPISLLPLPGKILEKLIHHQLSMYLDGNSLLSDSQHGFRKNHPTINSVAQLSNFISTKMDNSIPVLSVFVDFRKAFDSVQHPMLLEKLSHLNLHHSVVDWVSSYLNRRQQRVFANNTYSNFATIEQGVPQGSVLGPLFYIIYANDLVNIAQNCGIALYADDTVLYTANPDFDVAIANMQSDVDAMSQWCKVNGIQVNIEKTKLLVFGGSKKLKELQSFSILYDGSPILPKLSYKYLGITLDRQLNFGLHVNGIVSSVTEKLKQFQRMRSFMTYEAALLVYKSMLLPVLEYGDIFLSAATAVNRTRLQTLQNRGLRCALGRGIETSNDELHSMADLLELKYRREQHLYNFMYNSSLDPKCLKKIQTAYCTRASKKKTLKIRHPVTERFKKSIAYNGPKKWNNLPADLQHIPAKQLFKLQISNYVWQKSQKAKLAKTVCQENE